MNKNEILATINKVMSYGIRTSGRNEQGEIVITYALLNDKVVFNPKQETVKLNSEETIKL